MTEKIAFDKYLYKPFLGSSHFWAMQRLADLPENSKVLDIGPGSGFLAEFLNSQGKYQLYAVEPDRETADKISSKYQAIYASDCEVTDNDFDLIVLLDVLEHTATPEQIFKNLLKHLKPGGRVLISVPNIAHWSVRLPLLFGFFEYQERGPLDKTHLQFFSKRRFKKLISSSEIENINTNYSIEPLELVLPKLISSSKCFELLSKLRQAFCHFIPGLMAYQFLAELKKVK